MTAGTAVGSGVAGPQRFARARRRAKVTLYSALVLVVTLGVWEAIAAAGLVHRIILPPPSAVLVALVELVTWELFPYHVGITLYELLMGFFIGSTIGIVLGVVLASIPITRAVLYPYIVAFQALPKVALAPIFVTWFGFGLESKIVMAVTICFFPVVVNTLVGLTTVDESAMKLMRSLTATRYQIFVKLLVPGAMPMIMAGLKTSLTFATIGAIVGEFIGGKEGLGYLIHVFNFQMSIPTVFAVIVFLAVLSTALYLIIELVDRRVVFWVDREQR
jgi:NitT/TauT family transport system permease protein